MSDQGDFLIHPDEALRLVIKAAPPPRIEEMALGEALGRAMPASIASPIDHPPFDKSAMDGFAFRADDRSGAFRVKGIIAAGDAFEGIVGPGECARIMTGAPIPAGATAVQRVEWTEAAGTDADGHELVRWTRPETGSNVIGKGENLGAGALLLSPRVLMAQDIGILASAGIARVPVSARPRVGVLSTGDELRVAGEALGKAAIYDSNGPQLLAQAQAAGAEARFYGIAEDDESLIARLLAKVLDECDVLLVSGGVSMGDFDHVPRTLASLGVTRVFHKVAMRPGKPTWFGTRGDKAVFGLPGNPVSTFVNFEFLVKAHLRARLGLAQESRIVRAAMGWKHVRREADRVDFIPARLSREAGREGEVVLPLGYKGSSMLSALAEADCLVRAELGVLALEEGDPVDARLIRA